MGGVTDDLLAELRPAAFAIAYRMLGSVAEAEDVVQEALLRLHRTLETGEHLASPRAYLSTVVTRLAIDELRSARVRRETYVGEWLPEPLVADPDADPARRAELTDSLSMAFLALLEQLSPEQRAAFLLRDVFDYGYGEIAEIVGVSESNARQLASRARSHVGSGRPRFTSSREQREELARRFLAAAEEGDLAGLEALLAPDVELHGDGGGKRPALAQALSGRNRVARAVRNWGRFGQKIGARIAYAEVNGGPGAMVRTPDGELISVMALEIAGGEIIAIRGVVNPDKLQHVTTQPT